MPDPRDALLSVAEDIIRRLPLRLQGKYFSLRTAILFGAKPRDQRGAYRSLDSSLLNGRGEPPPPGPAPAQGLSGDREAADSEAAQRAAAKAIREVLQGTHAMEDLSQVSSALRTIREAVQSCRESGAPGVGGRRARSAKKVPPVSLDGRAAGPSPSPGGALSWLCDATRSCVEGCSELAVEVNALIGQYQEASKQTRSEASAGRIARTAMLSMNRENENLAKKVRALEAECSALSSQRAEAVERLRALTEENNALSERVLRLEGEAREFQHKLEECDAAFRRCHQAYGDSLVALQKQSAQQINAIGMQLAVTHDRLRRYRKIVDSLPVGESLSSMTSMDQSFASGLYDSRAPLPGQGHAARAPQLQRADASACASGQQHPRPPSSPPKRVPSKLSGLLASQGSLN